MATEKVAIIACDRHATEKAATVDQVESPSYDDVVEGDEPDVLYIFVEVERVED
jgi:hypothetical protein